MFDLSTSVSIRFDHSRSYSMMNYRQRMILPVLVYTVLVLKNIRVNIGSDLMKSWVAVWLDRRCWPRSVLHFHIGRHISPHWWRWSVTNIRGIHAWTHNVTRQSGLVCGYLSSTDWGLSRWTTWCSVWQSLEGRGI